MWRRDGLCRIHAELGHEALCKTCREFPRLRHDYGDFVELGLELSCPEAARLILSSDGNSLVEDADGGEAPEYDAAVMQILKESRQQALAVLRDYPLPQALAIILLYAHDVQAQIDGEEAAEFQPKALLAEATKYAGTADVGGIFKFFAGLEILTEDWSAALQAPAKQIRWSEPLMRYLIGRYWLQAISDFDLICRVKFMVISCILVGSLEGDFTRAAQLFSKEIENDPDNVEAVLDGAFRSPALTDLNLFSILMG
jgi:lysine-N-methylase